MCLLALCSGCPSGCEDQPNPDGGADMALTDGGAGDLATSLASYGQACAAALGKLPSSWSCQQDGSVLLDVGPIDGPDGGTTCPNPPWLGLNGHQGQCIPGARLLALPTTNPDTVVRVICRRYTMIADPVGEKHYPDVAVVASNAKTGATCFFQALDSTNDGTDVPSPMSDPNNPAEAAQAARAATFWLAPTSLNNEALKCSLCHDNDAWMHTPYVDQADGTPAAIPNLDTSATRNKDSWDKDTIKHADPYDLVQRDFFVGVDKWPAPVAVRTAKIKDDTVPPPGPANVTAQVCTRCHRISAGTAPSTGNETGQLWIDWTTQGQHVTQVTMGKPNFLDYHYMPDETLVNDGTKSTMPAQWDARWLKHVKAIQCCANNPTYKGCASYPIFGVKSGDKSTPGNDPSHKCVDDTGEVALGLMIAPPAYAGRADGDFNCMPATTEPRCVTMKITHTLVDGSSTTITEDETGLPLGYCIPDNSGYRSDYPVFPGDVVELDLDGTSAWDASFEPLEFSTWTGSDPKQCPCENPTSTQCRFTTKGASDWFGDNPDDPQFDGDPPEFACAPQFAPSGTCNTPPDLGEPDADTCPAALYQSCTHPNNCPAGLDCDDNYGNCRIPAPNPCCNGAGCINYVRDGFASYEECQNGFCCMPAGGRAASATECCPGTTLSLLAPTPAPGAAMFDSFCCIPNGGTCDPTGGGPAYCCSGNCPPAGLVSTCQCIGMYGGCYENFQCCNGTCVGGGGGKSGICN